MVRGGNFKSEPESVDPATNVHELNPLVFPLVIFLAATPGARGFNIPTVLRSIAEDATLCFLHIRLPLRPRGDPKPRTCRYSGFFPDHSAVTACAECEG